MTNAEWILSLDNTKFSDLTTKEEWDRQYGYCTLYIYKDDENGGCHMIDYCRITREEAANKDLVLIWLDRQQDFLTTEEREYLKNLIPHLPHPSKINGISKEDCGDDKQCYLQFHYDDGKTIEFPPFPCDEMYKDMELNDFYNLDELEIDNLT